MSKNIAVVVIVAGVLGLPGSVQAGGPRYDDYTAAGTTVVTTHLIHPGLRYLPFQFVKRRSLRRRCTHRRSTDGYLFLLRLPQAAANITIGLETTVQTRATRHHTWARDGENAATAHVP